MDADEKKFLYSVLGVQLGVVFLASLSIYLRTVFRTKTVAIISGGLYFIGLLMAYIVMIVGFSGINKIKKGGMYENYKKSPNYPAYVGITVQSALILAGGIIYLLVTYAQHDFVNISGYEKIY